MGHRETDDRATDSSSAEPFDAVVVGTGFGGAVTACRLVQAGFHVCILERGRRYRPGDFPDLPRPRPRDPEVTLTSLGTELPDLGRWFWQRDQGLWDVQNLGGVQTFQAAGWGGGSLLYAAVHLRAPVEVLRDWPLTPSEHGDEGPLDPWYDLASYMLQLQRIDEGGPVPSKTRALDAAAKAMGRQAFHPPLAVNVRDPPAGGPGHGIQPCIQCGACSSGCGHRAKRSLDLNYLHVAERDGSPERPTEVRTLAEVVRLEPPTQPDEPWTVWYRDHLTQGIERDVQARRVFLCMGSIHTTEFLLRHQQAGVLELSDELGVGYQPNADALKMIYGTREPIRPSWGPTITSAIVMDTTRGGTQPGEWVMIQDGGYDRAFQPVFSVMRGAGFLGGNRHADAEYDLPLVELRGTENDRASGWADVEPDGRVAARPKQPSPAQYTAGDDPPEPPPPTPPHRDVQRDTVGKLVDAVVSDGLLWDWLPRALRWDTEPGKRGAVAEALRIDVTETYRNLWKHDVLRLVARSVDSTVGDTLVNMEAHPLRAFMSRTARRWIDEDSPSVSDVTRSTGAHLWDILGSKSGLGLLGPVLRWVAKIDAPDLRQAEPRTKGGVDATITPDPVDLGDPERTLMLLCMGRDGGSWNLRVESRDDGEARIDPERWRLVAQEPDGEAKLQRRRVYQAQTNLARDIAVSLGGELRDNPGWSFLRTPLTVHSQGGCRIGRDRSEGVCDEYGRVFDGAGDRPTDVIPGLYVLDGSLHPSAVGVNPSHTIAALAERGIHQIIRTDLGDSKFTAPEMRVARDWAKERGPWHVQGATGTPPDARPIGLRFRERMMGFVTEPLEADDATFPPDQAACLEAEGRGRGAGLSLDFQLEVEIPSVDLFLVDPEARGQVRGTVRVAGAEAVPVAGTINVLVRPADSPPGTYHMQYELTFELGGAPARLRGRKFIHDDPGPDAWNDTTALFCLLEAEGQPARIGMVRMSLTYFLTDFLPGMHVTGTRDPGQIAWTLGRFLELFTAGLRETYAPWLPALKVPR